ncbi:MAG: hypothetical protein ACLT8I_23650 [Blautia faecis]
MNQNNIEIAYSAQFYMAWRALERRRDAVYIKISSQAYACEFRDESSLLMWHIFMAGRKLPPTPVEKQRTK